MMSLWKIIRNLSAIAGLIMLMGAVGEQDRYTLALRQAAPAHSNTTMIIGIVLILPMIIHLLIEMYKEGKSE